MSLYAILVGLVQVGRFTYPGDFLVSQSKLPCWATTISMSMALLFGSIASAYRGGLVFGGALPTRCENKPCRFRGPFAGQSFARCFGAWTTHVPELVIGEEAGPARLLLCPKAVFRPRGDFPRCIAKIEVHQGKILAARIESLSGKVQLEVNVQSA